MYSLCDSLLTARELTHSKLLAEMLACRAMLHRLRCELQLAQLHGADAHGGDIAIANESCRVPHFLRTRQPTAGKRRRRKRCRSSSPFTGISSETRVVLSRWISPMNLPRISRSLKRQRSCRFLRGKEKRTRTIRLGSLGPKMDKYCP